MSLDYTQLELTFAQEDIKGKAKVRTVAFLTNLLSYNKDEFTAIINGSATWKDTANIVASLASAGCIFIPIVGPIASIFVDTAFSVLISFGNDNKPKPEEIMDTIAKNQVMQFFQGLTTGKLNDIAVSLKEINVKVEDLKKNAANYASFVSQYNILYSQMSGMFNQIITQPMEFRMKTLQIFMNATSIFMTRVMSLYGMRKTLKLTAELNNTLLRHLKVGQLLYLRNIHVEYQEKLNRLLGYTNTKCYFDYRNQALESFSASIYPILFSDPVLFPDGVYVDNPVYHYKVLFDDNKLNSNEYLNEFRNSWETLQEFIDNNDNCCYLGELSQVVVGRNGNTIVKFQSIGQNGKSTNFYPLNGVGDLANTVNTALALDKNADYQKATIGYRDYISVGDKTIGKDDGQMAYMDAIFKATDDDAKFKKIGSIHSIRFGKKDPSFYFQVVGLVDRGTTQINSLWSSCATVIAPCKYTSKSNATSNFDDVFIGFNSMQLATGGELNYDFAILNPKVTKFKVYIRVTCGYHTKGLQGSTGNYQHNASLEAARNKVLNDSLKDIPLKKVAGSVESELTLTKRNNTTNEKYKITTDFTSKLIECGTVVFNTPATNKLKIQCTKGQFIVEALIFYPVI